MLLELPLGVLCSPVSLTQFFIQNPYTNSYLNLSKPKFIIILLVYHACSRAGVNVDGWGSRILHNSQPFNRRSGSVTTPSARYWQTVWNTHTHTHSRSHERKIIVIYNNYFALLFDFCLLHGVTDRLPTLPKGKISISSHQSHRFPWKKKYQAGWARSGEKRHRRTVV